MKITKENGCLVIPDCVTVPFIMGDGVGAEITPATQAIVNAAVKVAIPGGKEKEELKWMEIPWAGGEKRPFKCATRLPWLPDETMQGF